MLIDVNCYREVLKKLWADTFGDSEEYIKLFFDCEYTPAECFGEEKDGEIISVLYLMKGFIKADGVLFEGRYLYAAATAERYRGKGIMSKLIKEAQTYAKDKGISFISLLPADDGLYGYYAGFGFEPIMKKHTSVILPSGVVKNEVKASSEEYFSAREGFTCPFFQFAENEWKYALSCLAFAGYEILKNSDDSYCIVNDDRTEILEFISSEENLKQNLSKLSSYIGENASVSSPYDLSDYCECKENRFGMVYFIDSEIKKHFTTDIYMNIALD